ncbi:hypothetical protein [Halohasta litorea]|uniref:Uncharacterized protein n=1 Tax=Halohasta litorea TaxID=869891 RepID=A0ABD6D7K5_9EURY|nr:hypothetical protein [Halohasta litorea]
MKLKRAGILLFGVGLGVALVSAVVVGLVMQRTVVACPGHEPAYHFEGISYGFWIISDGCNSLTINPLVTGGFYVAVAGLVVGLIGSLRERSTEG